MREAKTRMPLESAAFTRTGQIYSAMKNRFGERRVKSGPRKGKISQFARAIPFNLDELRAWLLLRLGNNFNGSCRCAYCSRHVDAFDFCLDHVMPAGAGGDLGLGNLAVCCQSCNLEKGKISGEHFLKLRQWVQENLHPSEASDVFSRLKNGQGYLRTKWSARAKACEDDPDF